MVRPLLLYVAVCAIPVAVFWLAGRLLDLPTLKEAATSGLGGSRDAELPPI